MYRPPAFVLMTTTPLAALVNVPPGATTRLLLTHQYQPTVFNTITPSLTEPSAAARTPSPLLLAPST
jgi:hypothetical protein